LLDLSKSSHDVCIRTVEDTKGYIVLKTLFYTSKSIFKFGLSLVCLEKVLFVGSWVFFLF